MTTIDSTWLRAFIADEATYNNILAHDDGISFELLISVFDASANVTITWPKWPIVELNIVDEGYLGKKDGIVNTLEDINEMLAAALEGYVRSWENSTVYHRYRIVFKQIRLAYEGELFRDWFNVWGDDFVATLR